MGLACNVLEAFVLTGIVLLHYVQRLVLVILPCVFGPLYFGLIVGYLVGRTGLCAFAGHYVPEQFALNCLFVQVRVANYVSPGYVHLPFVSFGAGAEDLESC